MTWESQGRLDTGWIHSFLLNCYQTVLVNIARSKKVKVKSGVTQGLVLGRLLFFLSSSVTSTKKWHPPFSPVLHNTLPPEIHNLTNLSVDCFKRRLDKYLLSIPDEPQIPGYTAQSRAESNSLLGMTHLATAHLRSIKVLVPALPWYSDTKRSNRVTRWGNLTLNGGMPFHTCDRAIFTELEVCERLVFLEGKKMHC